MMSDLTMTFLVCHSCKTKFHSEDTIDGLCNKCGGHTYPNTGEAWSFWKPDWLLSKDALPPFICEHQEDGTINLLIGMNALDGGKFVVLDKHITPITEILQEKIKYFKSHHEGLESDIRAFLSWALYSGWYVHVSKDMMDQLNKIDRVREQEFHKNTIKGLTIEDKLHVRSYGTGLLPAAGNCPNCKSDNLAITMTFLFGCSLNLITEDGSLDLGKEIDSKILSARNGYFGCRVCGTSWEAEPLEGPDPLKEGYHNFAKEAEA
jgi:hypothetical protein